MIESINQYLDEDETRFDGVYQTEEEAKVVADEITSEWTNSNGNSGYNCYVYYSVSRGGYIVRVRPFIPGLLT